MGLAIVAIPEEYDRAWKASSEKVPHLTLLFLGDAESADLQTIMEFTEHAVTQSEHGPFYLSVDHRGTLGADDADVVFFDKRSWNLKWVRQLRAQLLQNDAVRTAYDSTEQFEEWHPHLTLGYPETPAHPLPNDEPLYSVCFDRIAVWADNYEGPEFRLEWPDREFEGDLAVAYSDTKKAALTHYTSLGMSDEEIIEHTGKKGMKWGVRNDRKGRNRWSPKGYSVKGDVAKALLAPIGLPADVRLAKRAAPRVKKGAKGVGNFAKRLGDIHFEGKASDAKVFMRVHNHAAEKMNASDIPRINNKVQYANANFKTLGPQSKLTRQYEKEMGDAFDSRLKEAATREGTNWSGTRKLEIDGSYSHPDGWGLKVVDTDKAKHDSGDDHILVLLERDEKGFITNVLGVDLPDSAMAQGEAFVEEILRTPEELGEQFVIEHFGIKGMRWGIRNRKGEPVSVTPTAASKVPHGKRRKTKIETEGGQNHPAHEDAIKVAVAKVKLKKSGPSALSNQELRDVANRVQLENQVRVLTSSRGKKFVKREFETGTEGLARKGIKKGAKKAATAALA